MLARSMTTDLTGSWEGHYLQNGRRHGISMRVAQRGQSFVGRMRDVDTLLASQEQLRTPSRTNPKVEQISDAEVMSTLPEYSIVEGEVEGRVVKFVKTYQGKSTTSVWVADTAAMTFESPGHQVSYLGTIDGKGELLTGRWSLTPKPGEKALRDRFELRRVPV
jgi:hypothetical protein